MVRSRLRIIAAISSVYLSLSFLLRILLWVFFGPEASVGLGDLAIALLVGVLTDLHEIVYISLPLVLFLAFCPDRFYYSKVFRAGAATAASLSIFGIFYLSAVDFFFFEEFNSRFNLVAVDYLIYPTEVFVNLFESYPVVWFMLAAVLATWVCVRLLWGQITPGFDISMKVPFSKRAYFAAGHCALVLLLAFGLESDRIEASDNRVAVEIGNNGLNSLFRAFRTQELNFELYYKTIPSDKALALVRDDLKDGAGKFISSAPVDLTRRFAGRADGLGKMNVVVLCLESQGAAYVGAYGDGRGWTPYFDSMAKQGLLFRNVYATGTRTVRGLEAIATSFPPIPSVSILKRRRNGGIANWGAVMRQLGYNTSFLYGGFGYFDNMNDFFGGNGFDLSDRRDIQNPRFANIWGVSDEDLYQHAISYYDEQARRNVPFFSIVMSTSNHKPFTFPQGIEGIPAAGGGREAGVRYADYAVAQFIKEAQAKPWFENTMIVIVADHDARVYGRQEIPVKRYRIPLLIYAPGKIQAGVIEKKISQLDIAPTVLDLLGLPYEAPFFGQSAMQNPQRDNNIFLSHNHEVALLRAEQMGVLALPKKAKTFKYDRNSDDLNESDHDADLENLTAAYYQSAVQLFSSRQYILRDQGR